MHDLGMRIPLVLPFWQVVYTASRTNEN